MDYMEIELSQDKVAKVDAEVALRSKGISAIIDAED